jgi:hypothetical protein
MKNKPYALTRIILFSFVITLAVFTACAPGSKSFVPPAQTESADLSTAADTTVPRESPTTKYMAPLDAVWEPDTSLGIEGVPMLDFASEEYIIFHSSYGLFIYDLQSRQIIDSLDLGALDCHRVQGSDACELVVSADGLKVYMRTMETKKMYIWEWTAEPDISLYGGDFDSDWPDNRWLDRMLTEDVIPDAAGTVGLYSLYAVELGGSYGYLYASNPSTISGLQFIVDDQLYTIFEKNAAKN